MMTRRHFMKADWSLNRFGLCYALKPFLFRTIKGD